MVPAVDWGWQNDKAMTVGGGKQAEAKDLK